MIKELYQRAEFISLNGWRPVFKESSTLERQLEYENVFLAIRL